MINKPLEFFNRLNLPINDVLDIVSQYLPSTAFEGLTLQTTEVVTGGDKWQILPIRRCDAISIRNGKLAKLEELSVELETSVFQGDLEDSNDLFVYGIFGNYYCIKQPLNGVRFNIHWFGIMRNSDNMDLLWKTEYANLFMNLKMKDSTRVFEGLKRLKYLDDNSLMENRVKVANYGLYEPGNGVDF